MPNQTSSKPLPRAFALLAVALLAMCALGGVMASEDTEGALGTFTGGTNTSSSSNPYTGISINADNITGTLYVQVGSSVSISSTQADLEWLVRNVTSGYGLTATYGDLKGTITKAGTISIQIEANDNGVPVESVTVTLVAVAKGTPVTSISIVGASSVNKGVSITLSASVSPSNATDKSVTWSIQSGSTYASITPNGTNCTVVGKAAGPVVIKCTANDGSGKSATKTITVNNPLYYYSLYFDANGGSLGEWDGWEQKSATNNSSTLAFTIPTNQPTRSGYTFLGWAESKTATTAKYHAGDTIYVDYNDKTLYAVWKENKQNYYAYLYYNANGGSGAPSSQSDSIYASSASGSKMFTISSTKPTRSGYEFQGWSTTSGSSTAGYQPGSTISVSYGSSVTLYAVWKQTYTSTLNFDANGGTGAPSALTYTGTSTSAHTFTIPSTTPSKSGFIFKGWSESSSASTASYQPNSTISVPYNGTKTLYAVWQVASLDITSEPATKSLKVGQSWSYTPTVNVTGCTVTVSGADWLTVSNGKISGTPTTAGTYNVTVTVSKTGYNSDSQTFALKVYSSLGFNSVPGANGMFAFAE